MIVHLSRDDAPRVSDVERFDRLHVECTDALADMQFGNLCTADGDDQHVWLDIGAVRVAGLGISADDSFATSFDARISYARSKGWADADRVRAHVEAAA